MIDDFLQLHAKLEHEKEAHEDTKELSRRQTTLMNGCLHQLESQIKQLKEQISQIQTNNQNQQTQIDNSNKQINDKQTIINQLSDNLKEKSATIQDLEQANNRLISQQQTLSTQLIQVQQSLNQEQTNHQQTQQQITNLTNQLREKTAQNSDYPEQTIYLNEQITNLEDQISQLNKDLNEEQEHLRLAHEDITEKNIQITNLRQRPTQETYQRLINKLQRQQKYSTNRINNLNQKADNYLTELNELDQDFHNLENLLAEKNAKLSQALIEINDLQTRIRPNLYSNLQKKHSKSVQQIHSLNSNLALIKQAKNNLQTQLTQAQTLNQTLQDQINNTPACPLPHLHQHTCSPCTLNHFDCSHTDYQEIKQQRDNYQQQTQIARQEKQQKEQQIINQINQDLHLNLANPNLETVISHIKELIGKPPLTIYAELNDTQLETKLEKAQQTITKLEQQLKETTPFGEDLKVIKELEINSLEQLFKQAVDNTIKQQINQAATYQEVVSARQAFLAKHLGQQQNKVQTINYAPAELKSNHQNERIILISLLAVGLLSIGGLLMKLRGNKRK